MNASLPAKLKEKKQREFFDREVKQKKIWNVAQKVMEMMILTTAQYLKLS